MNSLKCKICKGYMLDVLQSAIKTIFKKEQYPTLLKVNTKN